ncbi:SDR family NAD(P)-dependent oxidoreductase [Microbacterium sp. NIBRBAC000506063]|uniref:SDR family NAD(P)-dependent oxidoreductase n=1 Tax=Microbacterium sp. NIBRBAC000506063 TaxID=2734618 RepID=UPI001BB7B264|nr:SDR family oxidoreductase [Microbacterium sp. NIBRBAC000506063]QTV79074.1 SDR family oxidoreductase [Microbacterium sp. NIBRBAC000506063]
MRCDDSSTSTSWGPRGDPRRCRKARRCAWIDSAALVDDGLSGWANQTDYGPAKAAERQLMENLAIEWAPLGVRVNAVAPGHTLTPMVEDMRQRGYDLSAAEQRTPLGRLAEPREIAEAIVWLLAEATHVTGQCLPVDGGWTVVGK